MCYSMQELKCFLLDPLVVCLVRAVFSSRPLSYRETVMVLLEQSGCNIRHSLIKYWFIISEFFELLTDSSSCYDIFASRTIPLPRKTSNFVLNRGSVIYPYIYAHCNEAKLYLQWFHSLPPRALNNTAKTL